MRSLGAVAVVVTLVLFGCADRSVQARPLPSVAPVPAVGASPSAADLLLERLLVRAGDLPAGYAKDSPSRGTTFRTSTGDSSCAHRFAGATRLRTGGALSPTARARASFSRASSGSALRALAFRYADADAAARVVTAVRSVFAACRAFRATDPTTRQPVMVALSPLLLPPLGVNTAAVAGVLTRDARQIHLDLVLVQRAASVALIASITPAAPDPVALQRAVRAAVARLTSGAGPTAP